MSELQTAIEAARRDLAAREDGQLIRGRRQAVLRALGDGEPGRARRARLARLTVEHVLPQWRAARPGDQDPEKLLEQVEGVLDGTVDPAEVNRAAGLLWSHVDNLILTTGPESPLLVGYASKALTSALRDEPPDPPDADADRTDFGRDPRRLDTAFVASTAAAGGTPWDDASDRSGGGSSGRAGSIAPARRKTDVVQARDGLKRSGPGPDNPTLGSRISGRFPILVVDLSNRVPGPLALCSYQVPAGQARRHSEAPNLILRRYRT
jgi:hypothetical protein